MEKRWSKTEIAFLERHAADKSLEELVQRFHTDAETVRRKLDELGLTSSGSRKEDDTALEHLNAALEWLAKKQWKRAATELEIVIAEADSREIIARARQYLAVCESHLEKAKPVEDPYLEAVLEKNRGRLEEALEICGRHAAKDDERYAYLLSSIHALAGNEDEALAKLADAIRLEPKNRVHAYHDPDFSELRGREEFAKLLAAKA